MSKLIDLPSITPAEHEFDEFGEEAHYEYVDNEFFAKEKLACQCCGEYHYNSHWLRDVIHLRREFGKGIICVSGYRCEDHPIERKKSRPGAHTHGRAMDCRINPLDYADFVELALELNFRIGIKMTSIHKPPHRLHIDNFQPDEDGGRWQTRLWTYSK